MLVADEAKRAAAAKAAEFVTDGDTVGLGSGSTAALFVRRLGERVKAEGLSIRGVPTSEETARIAREVGVPLATLDEVTSLDVTIDGADEVDPTFDLVKGLGGALLREKVVASISKRLVIIVDEAKLVEKLGTRSPVPVEVVPFSRAVVERRLAELPGARPVLREKDGKPYMTDNGNVILDVHFAGGLPLEASVIDEAIRQIPGAVETGLFIAMATEVIVGDKDGTARLVESRPPERKVT